MHITIGQHLVARNAYIPKMKNVTTPANKTLSTIVVGMVCKVTEITIHHIRVVDISSGMNVVIPPDEFDRIWSK